MSKVIEYYNNISDRTIALLLEQFKNKENFIKFIEVLTKETQDLEYIYEQISELTWLDGSSGIQLDRLGEIIGYERGSRDDEKYRAFLRFGILINKSAGEPEILITALAMLTQATFVRFFELFPAACFGHTNGQLIPPFIVTQMDNLALGGVNFMYVSQANGVPFGFDPESSETGSLGFGWIDGGGQPITDNAGEFAWALPDE